MKSKSILSQIEFIIMVLVFALAAAVCLKVFAFSDKNSKNTELKSIALIKVQNTAEQIKNSSGKALGENGLCIYFTDEWEPSEEETKYVLRAYRTINDTSLLGTADVAFYNGDDIVFAVPIAWQEETS